MSFSDLPTELVRAIFEEIFIVDWEIHLDLDKTLSLRLVCKEFNAQVKHCGLGSIQLPVVPRRPWRHINNRLLALVLEQKVILPPGKDIDLINKIRETANVLRLSKNENVKSPDAILDNSLAVLCNVAVANLAPKRIWQVSPYDEEVMMLSPAAATGNIALMKDLLKDGADVNGIDKIFGSPLHAAAVGGHEGAARLLIEAGADIEYLHSTECGTAICTAASYGYDTIVRLLLEKGARVAFHARERQALHHAMANGGHEAVVIALIGNGAQVNAKTVHGETALHYGVSIGGREAVVRLLLKRGANIEANDDRGRTPLFIAAMANRQDMVKYLLARGADIQVADNSGKTILHHLVKAQAPISIIHQLINHGIQLDAKDDNGETALHMAVTARSKDVVALLVENRADVRAANRSGTTPLHNAVGQQAVSKSIVALLLKSGADVGAKDMYGIEALHMSVNRSHETITRLLLNGGASPNAVTEDGTTALHSASSQGNEKIVKMLLNRGADATAQRARGITPLHLAVLKNRPQVTDMLLKRGADPRAPTTASHPDIRKGSTALHLAATSCSTAELLLRHGAELEAQDDEGETVFFRAAARRQTETLTRLARLGADVQTANRKGNTALHQSAGSTEMTAALLALGVAVDARNAAGETALHLAAHGYNGVLKLLLDHGADVDALDVNGRTALHRASAWSNGHEASMQVLVRGGADRGIKDKVGRTALDLFRCTRRDVVDLESIIGRLGAL